MNIHLKKRVLRHEYTSLKKRVLRHEDMNIHLRNVY